MKNKNKRFVLSDESINSYGFKVNTLGIDLERFKANPVMLYNHDTSKVIGRWEDIQVENNQLTATPVFDENDELALTIKNKVNNDFIKGASIGMNVLEMSKSSDPNIAEKTELFEASITPFPSNKNALTLVNKNGVRLSDAELIVSLSLSDFDINNALQSMFNLSSFEPFTIFQKVQALQNENHVLKLSIETKQNTEIQSVLQSAIVEGRFKATEKSMYETILKQNIETGKQVISNLPKMKKLTVVNSDTGKVNSENMENWTLSEYRKKAPHLLRDKELYEKLINQEYNQS